MSNTKNKTGASIADGDGVKMEWDDVRDRCEEALAELDKAAKVLTDEEIERLCNTPFPRFSDVLCYVRDNGYLAPSAGLTVDEAMQAVRDWYAPWDCTNNIWDDLRARLNEKLNTKNQ